MTDLPAPLDRRAGCTGVTPQPHGFDGYRAAALDGLPRVEPDTDFTPPRTQTAPFQPIAGPNSPVPCPDHAHEQLHEFDGLALGSVPGAADATP